MLQFKQKQRAPQISLEVYIHETSELLLEVLKLLINTIEIDFLCSFLTKLQERVWDTFLDKKIVLE